MHVASRKRFESVIRFLVEKGARIDVKNEFGETPLALALRPQPPPPGAVIATFGMVLVDEGPTHRRGPSRPRCEGVTSR